MQRWTVFFAASVVGALVGWAFPEILGWWRRRSTGTPKPAPSAATRTRNEWYGFDLNDERDVRRIDSVRGAFGNVLEHNPTGCMFRSTEELAHSADEIRRVLNALLAVAERRASSPLLDTTWRQRGAADVLRTCLSSLDDFLPIPAKNLPTNSIENISFGSAWVQAYRKHEV